MMEEASEINIVSVTINELETLQAISKTTFTETFAGVNTETNMRRYLNENLSLDKLREEITNPFSQFFFAVHQKKIIGFLKVNFPHSQSEKGFVESLEIERIYVLKEFQSRKTGHLLLEKAKHIAKEMAYSYLWLGVWKHNLKAINFYKRHGFVEFGTHVFQLGDDKQIDILMKLNLN